MSEQYSAAFARFYRLALIGAPQGASVDLEAVAKAAREEVAEAQDKAPQGR